jgi:hypothetical protein
MTVPLSSSSSDSKLFICVSGMTIPLSSSSNDSSKSSLFA